MSALLPETRRARFGFLCVLGAFALNMVFLVSSDGVGKLPWLVMYPLLWLAQRVAHLDPSAGFALNVLAGYWGRFILLMVVLAWGICGLRPRDVGLRRGQWREALVATVLMWGVAQVVFLVISLASTPRWVAPPSQGTLLAVSALTLKDLAGVALFEETFYRGLMLPQVYHLLSPRLNRHTLLVSMVLSQLFFALAHIPHYPMPLPLPLGLLFLWISGILFAWMWVRTGNLLIVVGWHGLSDYFPFPVVGISEATLNGVMFGVGLLFLAAWPWMREKFAPAGGSSVRGH